MADGTILYSPAKGAEDTVVAGIGLCADDPACILGIGRSDDGGMTWRYILPDIEGSGVSPHVVNQDPFLYLDPVTSRAFYTAYDGPGATISWTDDGGDSWQHGYVAGETDHQQLFAGPPRTSSMQGYPNVVYYCAYSLGATAAATFGFGCSKSLDGGLTFLPGPPVAFPLELQADGWYHLNGYCPGNLDHGIADREGILYIPRANCEHPWLFISEDEGVNWKSIQVSTKQVSRYPSGNIVAYTSVAVDDAGNIYYLWVADDMLPWLTTSTDRGATWSVPIQVAAPGVKEAALVQVVAGAQGRVAVSYLGSSNAPGYTPCSEPVSCVLTGEVPTGYEEATWDAYMALIPEALAAEPAIHSVMVSGDGSDPVVRGACGPGRCVGEDFVDLKIGPDGTPYAVFVDHCTGECVTGATNSARREAVIGRLIGGPNLWGDHDPNGPYPN